MVGIIVFANSMVLCCSCWLSSPCCRRVAISWLVRAPCRIASRMYSSILVSVSMMFAIVIPKGVLRRFGERSVAFSGK